MTLALLLVLAAPTADAPKAGVPATSAAHDTRPLPSFRVAPLQLGPAAGRPFQLRWPVRAQPERSSANPTETQLTNGRTGVTCTMRILPASATDPGIGRPIPEGEGSHDPIVRKDLSPCLE
jgi:hypothetical protein